MWPFTSRSRRGILPVLLLAAVLSMLVPSSAAHAAGDDYPYKAQTNVNAADKWGFTQRQCVSFVAWRMTQGYHPINNSTQHWGSARDWDDRARALHVAVSATPKKFAVAQWNAGEKTTWRTSSGYSSMTAGPYGHVAFVRYVYSDHTVLIEQYNMGGNRAYSTMRVKAPRFLYLQG